MLVVSVMDAKQQNRSREYRSSDFELRSFDKAAAGDTKQSTRSSNTFSKISLKPIDQQVVVVFGASRGIGREAALRFANRGA